MVSWRFFRVVTVQSGMMRWALLSVTGVALVRALVEPTRSADGLLPLIVLQMFAASSGFEVPARRGHFDWLVTGPTPRTHVALTHCVCSGAPGLVACLVAGVGDWGLHGTPGPMLHSGTWAAMLMVTAVGWAITVPLPRLSGGVLWVVVMIAVGVLTGRGAGLSQPSLGTGVWWGDAAVFVVCPLASVGLSLTPTQWWVVGPGLAIGVAALCGALYRCATVPLGLEAGQ